VIESEGGWLQTPERRNGATIRVVSVPPAGTGPDHDRELARSAPAWIEWWIACPPGRGIRQEESPVDSLAEYVSSLAVEVRRLGAGPVALFGHSMGAMVAWETARLLQSAGDVRVHHLFVSGHSGPSAVRGTDDHRRSDSELSELLRRKWGGLPDGVAGRPDLEREVIRRLREDLTVLERHVPPALPTLSTPITALGGLDDPLVDRVALTAWSRETTGDFRARQFPGDHGYLTDATARRVVAFVAHRLGGRGEG